MGDSPPQVCTASHTSKVSVDQRDVTDPWQSCVGETGKVNRGKIVMFPRHRTMPTLVSRAHVR